MAKKAHKTAVKHCQAIVATTCFITAFLPLSAIAAEPKNADINANLQTILKRIQQKYDALNAQQAEQAKTPPAPAATNQRQNSDNEISGFSDASASAPINAAITAPSSEAPVVDNASEDRFSAGEELILNTTINGLELASIFAVKSEQGLRIGLADFCQIAEFPIDVKLANTSASGWYLKESNQFSMSRLSDGRLEVKAAGKSHYIDPKHYEVGEDILVEMDDLARWFGLTYVLDGERLILAISSDTKFPMELRKARQNTNPGKAINAKSVMPLKESGYTAFSPPMLDIQTFAQKSEQVIQPAVVAIPTLPNTSSTAPASYVNKQTSANYSILANHDLAFLNTELFLAGNKDIALSNARLTMSRQSSDAELLGPLHATNYSFGDVAPLNAGFGNTQAVSRGFSLDNTPVNQLGNNRKVNITGPIQTGWDAELYRNGVLIEQRSGLSDGRYEFNDIELDYGNNDFKLIFYGPQGQTEVKTESYVVDSNNVTAGQGMYRFSLVEIGESIFNVDPKVNDPTQQGLMASTLLDYGVTDWLAINAGSSIFEPKQGQTEQFVTLGSSASFGKAGLLSARLMQDNNELQSADLNYRARLFNTSYAFNLTNSKNLNETTGTINTTDLISAHMAGQLLSKSWLTLSYQNGWQRIEAKALYNRKDTFQNTLGISSRLGYFSNSLIRTKEFSEDPLLTPEPIMTEDSLNGSLQYRKSFGLFSLRAFNNYAIKPSHEVFNYGGTVNYSWSPNFNAQASYTYFNLTDQYQTTLGLNWRKDAFYLTTNASYHQDGSWSAGLGLRFSLGYEPVGHSIFTSSRPISQSGAVAVRVFEDLNMNGVYDDNERPIENATVKAVQAYSQQKTNDAGVAVLSSIYNNTTTDVVVDESTLDGPFMITAIPGLAITARKGYVEKLDLPVVKSGEVEGIIYLKDQAGASNPAPYINLNLIDKKDKVVATTRSEFDGYYLFTRVLPGNYRLQVDESYVDRRELKTAEKPVDFSANGDTIEGFDFVLKPLDEAAGFIANAGHFDSPKMLKLYYSILRRKMGNKFIQTPFFIKLPDKGGYLLGLAYFKGDPVTGKEAQQKAAQACASLTQRNIHCDVQYQQFKY